ncbi:hypothetical protein Q7A53_05640 [Halobacillus rhizosphaerae]|uniref:hypothetical protein n=1 Tax=Halobacillus rhizosphaerae TaxID=3064889 RepID=UPI00398B550B
MPTITVTEAGRLLGVSKEEMKKIVEKENLTKISPNGMNGRYLLIDTEIKELRG